MSDADELRETASRLAIAVEFLDTPFILQKYAPSDLIVNLHATEGGHVVSEPYRGQPFDPLHCKVVKGGWNHDHCWVCGLRVGEGDEWWAESRVDGGGLCLDCHSLLDRSRQDPRFLGLTDRRMGVRPERELVAAMTEQEWLTSTRPQAMLKSLEIRVKGGEFLRKSRLFGCGCVRRVWHLLEDDRSRRAVEMAESYADGLTDPETLDNAGYEASLAASDLYISGGIQAADEARLEGLKADEGAAFGEKAWLAAKAADAVTARRVGIAGGKGWYEGGAWIAASSAAMNVWEAMADAALLRSSEAAISAEEAAFDQPLTATDPMAAAAEIIARQAIQGLAWAKQRYYEERWQADLLRCVFGNPVRPVAPDSIKANAVALELARSINEHRSFDRLPDLANALEEAGCRDAPLLDHCRRPGDHARGCWAVDAVLGKS